MSCMRNHLKRCIQKLRRKKQINRSFGQSEKQRSISDTEKIEKMAFDGGEGEA